MFSKPSKEFFVILAAFIFFSVVLLPFFQYHINPDGICYLRIARYYAQGNFNAAVNGCWSPLISWLLAPLFKIGLPELVAFRLLNIIIACVALQKINIIVSKFFNDIPYLFRLCIVVSCALELLILHFNTITPDLLTLCLLLYLLDIYLSGDILSKPFTVGVLGALLYFTKAYSFYFFGVFISACFLQKLLQKKRLKKEFQRSLLTLFIFLALSGCWILALHSKYKEWTISTASGYVFSILDEQGVVHHPFQSQHTLRQLPYPEAYFSWEDMPLIYKQSTVHTKYHKDIFTYLKLIFINSKKLVGMFLGKYFLLSLFLVPLVLFFVWKNKNTVRFLKNALIYKIIFFVALYISGYFLISVEPRYIWILLITATMLLFQLVYYLICNITKKARMIMVLIMMIPFFYTTITYLATRINVNKDDYDSATEIVRHIPAGSHIAGFYSEDLWNHLFLFDLHNYGGIASYPDDASLMSDVNKYSINYIVLHSEDYYQNLSKTLRSKLPVYYKNDAWVILKTE